MLAQLKQKLAEAVAASFPDAAVRAEDFGPTPSPEMGDLAYPCFGLAKAARKAPPAIAQELAASMKLPEGVAAAEAAGPYVNFRFDKRAFAHAVAQEILAAPEAYGSAAPTGRKIMIEYGQPNTHKEIHVGHLRNFCLGLSVVRLAQAAGHEVVRASYVGDIGAHVAKCLWALKKFHADETVPAGKGRWLGQIYAGATRRIDDDPSQKAEVAEVQQKLEARDPSWDALWRETRQWSVDEFAEVFSELGIAFDKHYYESEVEEPGKQLAHQLVESGLAKVGEGGALIVDLEQHGLGVFLILKSDGTALYSTKELALGKKKFAEFPDIGASIHVVDTRQSLYFKQYFKTMELMGFSMPMVHLAYDFVTLKEGAMSSRKGNIISYEDFRDAMVADVRREIDQRHEGWSEAKKAQVAWQIAEGAMKFGMLKQDNDKPIVFDMDASRSFDGFTGPYIQYSHARLSAILAKAGERGSGAPDEAAFPLLRKAAEFPEVIAAAARDYRPAPLAEYLFHFAQEANAFYRDVPVLAAEPELRSGRLAAVAAAQAVLSRGLSLLGIAAPEEM